MAKFHVRLKLQGLEFEVDGERQDIPAITSAMEKQFAGLLEPAAAVADGHNLTKDIVEVVDSGVAKSKNRSRKRSRSSSSGEGTESAPLEFRHDPEKYGNPEQSWSITEKCIWLLYVIGQITGTKEASGPQLAATFNHYFKAAGKLHPPHVPRELSKVKIETPAPIGEDKGLYFLTNEGEGQAQRLIQNIVGPPTA